MKTNFSALILIGLALLAPPAVAKPDKNKSKGKAKKTEQPGKGNQGNPGKDDKGNPGKGNKHDHFNDKDQLELRNFFAPANRTNLPPGLRKNLERGKPLPPGWQKKVAAGQIMDVGWLNLMTPVSYDYFPNLRRTPGTRMYYHDNRLVRVNEETRVILDVINLLAR